MDRYDFFHHIVMLLVCGHFLFCWYLCCVPGFPVSVQKGKEPYVSDLDLPPKK